MLDWCELSESERQRKFESLLVSERIQGFKLSKAPLMRLQLIREADTRYRLVWHHHHLLMDGWCLPILFTELFEAYSVFGAGKNPCLPSISPFKAYIKWLSEQDQEKAKAYWREQLEGFLMSTPLPMESPTQMEHPLPIASHRDGMVQYQELELKLDLQLSEGLKQFGRQHRLTLNTLVQGAWAALLSRYSGESDVVFGVTMSGRQVPVAGIDRMLGLFINTLPLRVKVESDELDHNSDHSILRGLQTIL